MGLARICVNDIWMTNGVAAAVPMGRGKAASNHTKHRVAFGYATRVFLDPDRLELDASRPTDGEPGFKMIGMIAGKLYVVVVTRRGNAHRIISARRTNRAEDRAYGRR